MTGDVTEVRPLSPGSGEGPRQTGNARAIVARWGWRPINRARCRTLGSRSRLALLRTDGARSSANSVP